MIRKCLIAALLAAAFGVISYGQFADCSTGLLQAPTAEMQADGTFSITNLVLNEHSLSPVSWDYATFQYGISVSFWERIEVGYVCTLFNGKWSPSGKDPIMFNQDRHFVGRVCLLKEGEFGQKWIPGLVIGVSDPITGIAGDYIDTPDYARTNGYFNRSYVVLSKHFTTSWGPLGTHIGYQYNRRVDYPINGPCAGINWMPVWFQQKGVLDWVSLVLEYDSRTLNVGAIVSIWSNHFEAMFELQNFQWVNFGLRFKFRIKK